jgi:excisionase family DNA binding protein
MRRPRLSDYCTSTRAADILGVTKQRVYQLVADGILPAIRVGSQWMFRIVLVEKVRRSRKSTARCGHAPRRRKMQ